MIISRKRYVIVAAILVVYVFGYIGARTSHWIVHSVVRDHSNNYLEHSVRSGDGKFLGAMIYCTATIIYTPARFIETLYWYWQQPVGTPLSKKHLQALQE